MAKHLEAQDGADGLFRFLTSPDEVVLRVSEQCSIDTDLLQRRLELVVAQGPDYDRSPTYVELLNPDKGSIWDFEIEETAGVNLVGHDEHLLITQSMIMTMFSALAQSFAFIDGIPGNFWTMLARIMLEVASIPYQSPTTATAIINRHFHRKSRELVLLRALRRRGVLRYDRDSSKALYRMSKRFVRKYALLVRLDRATSVRHVRFSYSHQFSDDLVTPNQPYTIPTKRSAWESLREHNAYRVHLPWARKGLSYSLRVSAPDGYFYSTSRLLAHTRGQRVRQISRSAPVAFDWSINPLRGTATLLYISRAASVRDQLYLGLYAHELPGRSTYRARFLSVVAAALMLVFLPVGYLASQTPSDLVAVVLTLVSLTAAIFSSSPTSSLGAPKLARSTPVILAAVSVVFASWMFVAPIDVQLRTIHSLPVREFAVSVAQVFQHTAGILAFALSVTWSIVLSHRCRILSSRLRSIASVPYITHMVHN